jgi:hypothetical protein
MTSLLSRILTVPLAQVKKRGLLISGIVGFIAVYQVLYVTWLAKAYLYFGFNYVQPPWGVVLLSWVLSLLPALWSPIALTRPSQMVYWFLYFTVFVPTMFVPTYVRLSSIFDIVELMISFFFAISILGLASYLPLPKFRNDFLPKQAFWVTVALVDLGFVIWIASIFRTHLQLVSFGDIYELRSDADALMAGSRVGYAISWLAGSINPFLMAYALMNKKKLVFIAGMVGELFVYSATGNKTTVLSIGIIIFLYFLTRKDISSFATRLGWSLASGLGLIWLISLILEISNNTIINYAVGIAYMRTLGLPGLFSAEYYSFFHTHPVTHFSHVTGVNAFIHYPYAKAIGLEIAQSYMGLFDLNFNAHFWATDGIAGFGLFGVLLMSVICAGLFWVLDFAANGHSPLFAALALVFAAVDIGNTSLFTTIVSGGMFLSVLLLLLLPKN